MEMFVAEMEKAVSWKDLIGQLLLFTKCRRENLLGLGVGIPTSNVRKMSDDKSDMQERLLHGRPLDCMKLNVPNVKPFDTHFNGSLLKIKLMKLSISNPECDKSVSPISGSTNWMKSSDLYGENVAYNASTSDELQPLTQILFNLMRVMILGRI